MLRPQLEPPRTVSAPAGATPAPYRAWIEVAARVSVAVRDWGVAERGWVHWTVPSGGGAPIAGAARLADPARRASRLGEPAAAEREGDVRLDPDRAAALCAALEAGTAARLFRCPEIGLVSRLGEPRADFVARCLDAAAPALARGGSEARRRELASIVGAIEERGLGADQLRFDAWRVAVAWYPAGIEPAPPASEPPLHSAAGRSR